MKLKLIELMQSIPPMVVDGFLYVMLGITTFWSTFFGSDEAAKYIFPVTLFWLKCIVGTLSAVVLSMKLFRSTSYADNVAAKKAGETTFFGKVQEQQEKKP